MKRPARCRGVECHSAATHKLVTRVIVSNGGRYCDRRGMCELHARDVADFANGVWRENRVSARSSVYRFRKASR